MERHGVGVLALHPQRDRGRWTSTIAYTVPSNLGGGEGAANGPVALRRSPSTTQAAGSGHTLLKACILSLNRFISSTAYERGMLTYEPRLPL